MTETEKPITIFMVPADGKPFARTVENELHAMQELVGGFIQVVPCTDGIDLVCNEEGKLAGMPINPKQPAAFIDGDLIVGPYFFVRHDDEGGFCSITAADAVLLLDGLR